MSTADLGVHASATQRWPSGRSAACAGRPGRSAALDPRRSLHTAGVVLTIHVLGQVDARIRRLGTADPRGDPGSRGRRVRDHVRDDSGVLAWPASAMLTGSGVGLIFRVDGTVPGDHWSFHRWWWFSLVAIGSLLTKYVIRWRGSHLFNPSNVGLVVAFLVLGSQRAEPLPFHWSEPGPGLFIAYAGDHRRRRAHHAAARPVADGGDLLAGVRRGPRRARMVGALHERALEAPAGVRCARSGGRSRLAGSVACSSSSC